MTSTLTAGPARPAAPNDLADLPDLAVPARGTGLAPCPIELRALHVGARTLAGALTGIALDAPCDRARQRAVLTFARLVLDGVRSADPRLADDGVRAAAAGVREALPTFAQDVSAGAPALATACAVLADRLAGPVDGMPAHDHGGRTAPVACERRFRAAGPARAVVPWFLDSAGPAERMALVRDGSRRMRWALRLGEDRYARMVAAVRG